MFERGNTLVETWPDFDDTPDFDSPFFDDPDFDDPDFDEESDFLGGLSNFSVLALNLNLSIIFSLPGFGSLGHMRIPQSLFWSMHPQGI